MTIRKSTTLLVPLLLLLPLFLFLTGCDEDNPTEPDDSLDITPYLEGNRVYAVTTELISFNTQNNATPVTQLLVYAFRLIEGQYETVSLDSVHVNGSRIAMTADDIAWTETSDTVADDNPWEVTVYLHDTRTIEFAMNAMDAPVVEDWADTLSMEAGSEHTFTLSSMGQFGRVDLAGTVTQPDGGTNFTYEFYLPKSFDVDIPADGLSGSASVRTVDTVPVILQEYADADTLFQVWRYDDFIRNSQLVITSP